MRGEDRVLEWLRARPGAELLGDDTARLPAVPGAGWVATVDPQIGGVHVPEDLDEALVARRLLQVNLSDLAASGAVPAHALVALAAPAGFDPRRFLEALLAACAESGVTLAGGDLARAPTLCATMTLLGTIPAGGRFVSRGAGRAGDRLWVGGPLGEAGAGQRLVARGARLERPEGSGGEASVVLPGELRLPGDLAAAARSAVARHLAPRAQTALGAWLGRRPRAAALDVSDGLARDLPRLTRESGVGAEVEADLLPLAPGFHGLAAALGEDPLELALGGGEDYVLLFALPPEDEPPPEHGARAIGRLVAGTEVTLVGAGGEGRDRRPMPALGWDHLD